MGYNVARMTDEEPPTLAPQPAAWLKNRLADAGIDPEQCTWERIHAYPWSAVWRIQTGQKPLYLKLCAPSQAHEPALTAALAEWLPKAVLPVVAADPRHGWLLLPEGGRTLRQIIESGIALTPETLYTHWQPALELYATLQWQVPNHLDAVRGFGVVDQRPERLPVLFVELLSHPERLVLDEPTMLTATELEELAALLTRIEQASRELAASGIPLSIDHGDSYDKHFFVLEEGYRLFDWGDAVITHPFLTLTAVLSSIGEHLGQRDVYHPLLKPFMDTYLAPWSAVADSADLYHTADLATRLGCLPRALNWVRALAPHLDNLTPAMRAMYAEGVSYWLRRLRDEL
ncbi:MAG: hypothetical protein R3C44_14490 [Chloroflexota bacterium]